MFTREQNIFLAKKIFTELVFNTACFSVQRITIKMDCQPTTSTALPKSGISFF